MNKASGETSEEDDDESIVTSKDRPAVKDLLEMSCALTEVHQQYSNLLLKYARAVNFIDQLRCQLSQGVCSPSDDNFYCKHEDRIDGLIRNADNLLIHDKVLENSLSPYELSIPEDIAVEDLNNILDSLKLESTHLEYCLDVNLSSASDSDPHELSHHDLRDEKFSDIDQYSSVNEDGLSCSSDNEEVQNENSKDGATVIENDEIFLEAQIKDKGLHLFQGLFCDSGFDSSGDLMNLENESSGEASQILKTESEGKASQKMMDVDRKQIFPSHSLSLNKDITDKYCMKKNEENRGARSTNTISEETAKDAIQRICACKEHRNLSSKYFLVSPETDTNFQTQIAVVHPAKHYQKVSEAREEKEDIVYVKENEDCNAQKFQEARGNDPESERSPPSIIRQNKRKHEQGKSHKSNHQLLSALNLAVKIARDLKRGSQNLCAQFK